jgi:probable rRNA maturation factor
MSFHLQKHPAATAPDIAVSNRQRARKVDLRWLEKITAAALAELKIERAELGIVLVGAKEMASLNEEFLGHEGATDVITFDYKGPESGVHPPSLRSFGGQAVHSPWSIVNNRKGIELHGEIFVCVAEAERQAKIFGTDWRSEVVRYIVHGILHLLGHDDLQPLARKKMKREEGRLVRELSRCFALSKL